MDSFKMWLESLRDIIKPIPQSPEHHAEGNVWNHTRMVRKRLNNAIEYFKNLSSDKNSVFGNLNTNLSDDEINTLRLAAWIHDIGKASATTIEDGKIKAIGHEDPEHFEPMMQRLNNAWKKMYEKSSQQDKDDLWFIIQNHMKLHDFGFSKKSLNQLLDDTGKFKNDRKIKLLLILIMMDQSGRIKLNALNGDDAMPDISQAMSKSAIDYHSRKRPPVPVHEDPIPFLKRLKAKGLNDELIKQAFTGKFGREPTEEEKNAG